MRFTNAQESCCISVFFFTVIGLLGMFFIVAFISRSFDGSNLTILTYFFNNLDFIIHNNFNDFYINWILIMWFSLFLGFAVKVPMFPFHIWLPEAHVEAPTAGSIILAGILLKMGIYGIFRILVSFLPFSTYFCSPLIITMSLLSILYTPFTTIRQNDLKKIIAYSSIGHMGFCTLGLAFSIIPSISGSFFIAISHGLISSGLFMGIGLVYDRFKTRIIGYYGGLVQLMPLFTFLFFILTLANMSLPGTSSFIGEVLVLIGLVMKQPSIAIISCIGIIAAGVYSIWLFNRVFFGRLNVFLPLEYGFFDLTKRESMILIPLIFLTSFFGIFPISIIYSFELDLDYLINNNY